MPTLPSEAESGRRLGNIYTACRDLFGWSIWVVEGQVCWRENAWVGENKTRAGIERRDHPVPGVAITRFRGLNAVIQATNWGNGLGANTVCLSLSTRSRSRMDRQPLLVLAIYFRQDLPHECGLSLALPCLVISSPHVRHNYRPGPWQTEGLQKD